MWSSVPFRFWLTRNDSSLRIPFVPSGYFNGVCLSNSASLIESMRHFAQGQDLRVEFSLPLGEGNSKCGVKVLVLG